MDVFLKNQKEEKTLNKIKYLLIALCLMLLPTTAFAAQSPSIKDISKTSKDGDYYLEYSIKGWTYNGKFQYPNVVVTLVNTKDGSKTVLKEGTDYIFQDGQGTGSFGKHMVAYDAQKTRILGIGRYNSSKIVEFKISKAKASFSAKAKKSIKKSQLKKKAKKVQIKVTFGKRTKGFKNKKITYSKAKTPKKLRKYIKVSKSGKVTLKKGAPKGTYKISVKLKGTKNYKGMTKVVKIKVK